MDVVAVKIEMETAAAEAANKFFKEMLGNQDRGMCGFAWITVYPKNKGNTTAGKAERRVLESLGFRKDWTGKAYELWNPAKHGAQNVDVKEVGARAGAAVLKGYGLAAYAGSRLD